MKLGICIPTPEYGRFAACQDYIDQLEIPPGTLIVKPHGQSPAMNRNMAIDILLESGCDYILFLDDDVIVPRNLFVQLVKHNKQIVSGLMLARAYPHKPLIFKHSERNTLHEVYYPVVETGLVEVVNCGLGCCLIHKSIFEHLEKPYIRLGEVVKDHWCDDTGFFIRVKEAGYQIYCDLDAQVGHVASVCVTPIYRDGMWMVDYNTFGTGNISFPAIVPIVIPEDAERREAMRA